MGHYIGRCCVEECNKAVWDDGDGYWDYDRSELVCLRHRHRPQRPESPIEEAFCYAWMRIFASILIVPQHPVGGFFLDFGLPEFQIGIELDGAATHSSPEDRYRDRQRQEFIELSGWRVIRFTGSEVYQDTDACVRRAGRMIAEILQLRWTKTT